MTRSVAGLKAFDSGLGRAPDWVLQVIATGRATACGIWLAGLGVGMTCRDGDVNGSFEV